MLAKHRDRAVTSWRSSRPVAGLVIALVVVIQLAVPISRFDSDRAMRFGWQMFSASYPPANFVVTTRDGGQVEIDLDDYVVDPRVDVDLVRWLPPHLCQIIPEALGVTWDSGTFEC